MPSCFCLASNLLNKIQFTFEVVLSAHVIVSYTMGMSGLPDMYIRSLRAKGIHIWYNCYAQYSPFPGKLKVAQARKHTSLQAHCIYREDCCN